MIACLIFGSIVGMFYGRKKASKGDAVPAPAKQGIFSDACSDGWFKLALSIFPLILFCNYFLPSAFDLFAIIGALFALCLVVRVIWVLSHKPSASSRVARAAEGITRVPLWVVMCVMFYQASGGALQIVVSGYCLALVCVAASISKAICYPPES